MKKVLSIVMTLLIAATFMPSVGIGNADIAAAKTKNVKVKKPVKVKWQKCTAGYDKITLNWKKAKYAKKYEVQIKRPYKTWNKFKTVKKSKANKKRYTKKGKYKVKVTGKKYQVYKYSSAYTKTITSKKTLTIKKLKPGKMYKVRVRGINGKVAGKFSVVKNIKTKAKAKNKSGENSENQSTEEQNKSDNNAENQNSNDADKNANSGDQNNNDNADKKDNTSEQNNSNDADKIDNSSNQNENNINNTNTSFVQQIAFEKSAVSMTVNGTETLILSNPSVAEATYTSSNTSVVEVERSSKTWAVINAKGAGKATITAKAGDKTAKCTVSVTGSNSIQENGTSGNSYDGWAGKIYLGGESSRKIEISESVKVDITYYPSDMSNPKPKVVSSDNSVASVELSGSAKGDYYNGVVTITGKNPGKAEITAIGNEGKKDTIKIEVYKHEVEKVGIYKYCYETTYPEDGIEKPKKEFNERLYENRYYVLEPDILPYGKSTELEPVTWRIKENSIGATTEVKGRNLIITTPTYNSRNQYNGKIVATVSVGGVTAEKELVPRFRHIEIQYDELLKNEITSELRRSLLYPTLGEDTYIDADRYSEEIKATVDSVTSGCKTDREKVNKIIEWFHQNIEYIREGKEQSVIGTWEKKGAVCGGISRLLAQMLRFADIPAGQYLTTPDINHACTVFWMEGQWYTTDGTGYTKDRYFSYKSEHMAPIKYGLSCTVANIIDSELDPSGFNIVGGELINH